MKTVEIIGYKRANLGKQAAKTLRKEALVPGVLYGGENQIHFHTPMALLKELVYTPKAHFIKFNLEGTLYECILQDIQFHPVNEMILHIDFLQLFENKKIKMQIPTRLIGTPPGVEKGGNLVHKIKKLPIHAYPKDMPDEITIDISSLEVGQMVRVSHLTPGPYTILALAGAPIAAVETTRATRSETVEAKPSKK